MGDSKEILRFLMALQGIHLFYIGSKIQLSRVHLTLFPHKKHLKFYGNKIRSSVWGGV